MTPALEKEGPVVSTSSITVQRQAQRTSEETKRSHKQARKVKRKIKLAQTLPTRAHDSQIQTFSHRKCVQYSQNPYGIHRKGEGRDEHKCSMKKMDNIRHIKSIIDFKLGKFDT
ncbi:hypothetical protein O181_065358 [Austropuccinia psidii MF-1]|uniref:Uncharacterized protein n=1 Tax=Austropuccinia psidii MF-1 TaxID=1389203 RepID=A0A9Q3EV78_9BASI|nr:hypothetical protein [Austropuccinia psidii MF-1]